MLRESKRAKGIKNCFVKKSIEFLDYINCLKNETALEATQNCIRSKLHDVYSVKEKKMMSSANDDKRYLVKNSEKTLPWSHFKIMECE